VLLAGDIGGTKTDLAIYSPEAGPHSPIIQAEVHSADYPSLQALVTDFLKKVKLPVERACFDVAGPVIDGRVKITNLPWMMDEASLTKELNFKSVHLMNDLEAVARAVPILRPDDVSTLNVGQAVPGGAIAVVAPGTGLGESFLTWDDSKYVSHGSEGGHADFAPTNERQMGLLKYMFKRFDHVSVEHVCSGIGLPNIYQFFLDTSGIVELPQVTQSLAAAKDPTPVIVNAAQDKENPSPLCVQTLKMFMHILGGECGNMALKVLSTAGVYIGGGIPPRLLSLFNDETFMSAFDNKGRFKEMLHNVPVYIILNKYPALLGAAYYGFGA